MTDPRRHKAAVLFAQGATGAAAARALGLSRATGARWLRVWRRDPADFLRASAQGRRSRLHPTQLQRLNTTLAQPPRAHGIPLAQWSAHAIALIVEQQTGVRYHPRHIGRLLRRAGWVLPPHGKHADQALRRVALCDPDGNACMLQERSA